MSDLKTLIAQVKQEAQREDFPLDVAVYQSAGIEPHEPILYAGNLNSPLCFFGRDLGQERWSDRGFITQFTKIKPLPDKNWIRRPLSGFY